LDDDDIKQSILGNLNDAIEQEASTSKLRSINNGYNKTSLVKPEFDQNPGKKRNLFMLVGNIMDNKGQDPSRPFSQATDDNFAVSSVVKLPSWYMD